MIVIKQRNLEIEKENSRIWKETRGEVTVDSCKLNHVIHIDNYEIAVNIEGEISTGRVIKECVYRGGDNYVTAIALINDTIVDIAWQFNGELLKYIVVFDGIKY